MMESQMANYSIAVHGGAGTILKKDLTPELEKEYADGLEKAVKAGNEVLAREGTALDAVETALIVLEDNPLFNAGRGAVFTHSGTHELDASIMEGKTLAAGAVTCVRNVKNPVSLARKVMEKSEHVMLCGIGAESFAREEGILFETDEYFFTEQRYNQWQDLRETRQVQLDHTESTKFGTAGAVALDKHGNVAAATSTGGMTNKQFNRIGDTPIIGAGTYANNDSCAISCTGHGEFFIRAVAAYDVACLMEYNGLSLKEACEKVVLDKLVKLGGEGGLIGVDAKGNVALVFNTEGMYRAWQVGDGKVQIGIYKDQVIR
jgi:L-asparaginase / beta-aspartyl-peptidase